MSKWEVSSCINEFIFDFSSLYVYADNKQEALKRYITRLQEELNYVDIDNVLSNENGEIWEIVDD